MDDNLPERRNPRWRNYDYSRSGSYFITVCAHDKKQIFSLIVKDSSNQQLRRGESSINVDLTDVGRLIENAILSVPVEYSFAEIPYYVIMPDHFHMIIDVASGSSERDVSVSSIVRYIKVCVTSKAKRMTGLDTIFQRSFYDRVIRTDAEYEDTRDYILNNPAARYYREHPRKPVDCDE